MTNTSSFRRFFGLACLVLMLLTIAVPSAMATHLRGGTITWTPLGVVNGKHRVQFTLQEAQRWSYATQYGANLAVGFSGTLNGISGTGFFNVNGGTPTQLNPTGTVTSVNQTEDWMTATFTFTFDYASCTTDTPNFSATNRLSTLELGHDAPEVEYALVNPCATNGGPVASVPAVLAVPLLATTTFNLSTAVTDIDP